MSIDLIVQPRAVVSWDEFCTGTPPRSVALDGFVVGGPKWDDNAPRCVCDFLRGAERTRPCAQTAARSACNLLVGRPRLRSVYLVPGNKLAAKITIDIFDSLDYRLSHEDRD